MVIALIGGVFGSYDRLQHRTDVARSAKAATGWVISISDSLESAVKNVNPQSEALAWTASGVRWIIGIPCGVAAGFGAGFGNGATVIVEKIYDAFNRNNR